MAKDIIWFCDLKTRDCYELGEIQTKFNMSFVIDGTKDSAKVVVYSYTDYELSPNTLIYHEKTQTWWIVEKDNVERHANDDGYFYIHTLDLLGAIELLNSRDLIDCGFNDNTYTVVQFVKRLFSLSSFEFKGTEIEYVANSINFLDKKVDFIKTFENYTLLSALREFLDGYNVCPKITFNFTYQNKINRCYLEFVSKTGNARLTTHNMSEFDDVRQIKSTNLNSYGSTVVSNAENTISSVRKIYPAIGCATFSSNDYSVTFDNAVLRLPTNVYKVNSLKLVMSYVELEVVQVPFIYRSVVHFDDYNANVENFDQMLEDATTMTQHIRDYLTTNKESIIRNAMQYCYITFYNGVRYNPNDTFTIPSNVPYVPVFTKVGGADDMQVALVDEETKENLRNKAQGISWKRGSNLISGFEFLNDHPKLKSGSYTDGGYKNGGEFIYEEENVFAIYVSATKSFGLQPASENAQSLVTFNDYKCLFIIDYIPMADLKIKYDNQVDKNDIHLYNQNGKLTDCVALSKMLNSYSKEISSDTITKYKVYYDFNNVPWIGSIVKKDNVNYVINNISYTFTPCETKYDNNFNYYIECEITMSKYCAIKSLIVNPNTNIRDYGIPQNHNVKRKQLYRDFYELDFDFYSNANQETPYLNSSIPFNFGFRKNEEINISCFIEITYQTQIDGSLLWYYQLETTNYYLSKQFIIMLDFNDNNVIGYSQQNGAFVFDISHLFDQNSLINTPISYTDSLGRFKDIEILFINNDKRNIIDDTYYDDEGITFNTIDGKKEYDPLVTQVWIPWQLYTIAYNNDYYDFKLTLTDYYKDAIEVPVFEYCCQIDDSDNVLIGDDILFTKSQNFCFYTFVLGDNLDTYNATNTNALNYDSGTYTFNNYARMVYDNSGPYLVFSLYGAALMTANYQFTYGNKQDIPIDKDIAIFRMYRDENGNTQSELVMIIKKIGTKQIVSSNDLYLRINYYKLN